MWFRKKVVWERKAYAWPKSMSGLIDWVFVWKAVLFSIMWLFALYVVAQVRDSGSTVIAQISENTVKAVAKKTGDSMQQDTMWNINVLIAWYAWEEKLWWLLTDTIMVASFNPKLWTVTFLSLPRDMYITYHKWGRWRLNAAYRSKYIDAGDDHEAWADYLMEKVTEITGVDLHHYMFVSFQWFIDFIDSMGGVTIDVPTDLIDPSYPDNNNGYDPLTIKKWIQKFDGETALKYARSRKSTSDFSRTLRQQQIIKWVINELVWSIGITNVAKIKSLYETAMNMVKTNISLREIAWMVEYMEWEKRFFSFVYTAECDKRIYDLAYPWCVLVYGNSAQYNGQSVMLPIGATPWNINYYKHTKDFAFWVIHNQEFLIENAPIRIRNWVDKAWARRNGYNIEGLATRFAIDLKTKAFNVSDVSNADTLIEKSIVYVPSEWAYASTVELLRVFVDIDEVIVDGVKSWGDVTVVLGNDYLLKQ